MNVLDKAASVKPFALNCTICDAALTPLEVMRLPDFGGGFDMCCKACAASETFFDAFEMQATAWFMRLVADVPESLKPFMLETLGYAVTSAQMTVDTPQAVRRVPFTAALESGQSFGGQLVALGVMPEPRVPLSPVNVYRQLLAARASSAELDAVNS